MEIKEYIRNLEKLLMPLYLPPAVPGGYDINHIFEMLYFGEKIKAIPQYQTLDLDEFTVAVWLHNSDRTENILKMLREEELKDKISGFKNEWQRILADWLSPSPFTEERKTAIIDAVLSHSKKNDEPKDSVLLTALRIADKVVRFGPLGMMGQPANRGRTQMFYDRENPFEYGSTKESDLKAVINDYFRVLEWYKMLPCDEARALIKPEYLKMQISYYRLLGEQIADFTKKENNIERSIQQALGKYYTQIAF